MSKAIYSKNVATQNVLLRITIPKRTGRKRKRGTHDPFENAENELDTTAREANIPTNLNSSSKYRDTRTLLQMMQDNVGKYDVQVVGPIEQTHRFRSRLPCCSIWLISYTARIDSASSTRLCLLYIE